MTTTSSSCRWTRRRLFFNTGDGVTGIEVMVARSGQGSGHAAGARQGGGPGTRLVPWQDINSAFFEAVQVEGNVMFLILSLIILVAALNIISGLIMLVKDKSRRHRHPAHHGRDARRGDAGLPDRRRQHRRHRHGCWVLLLGVLFCANIENIRQGLSQLTGTHLFDPTIYFLSRMPADLDPGQVAAVVVMALALTFLATLYPVLARRAARSGRGAAL